MCSSDLLGGVYKLSARYENGQIIPKIKISENVWKITNPGIKKIVRIYGKEDHMAIADLIMLADETIDINKPLTIFDPIETWKKMTLYDYETRDLLVPVFVDGKQVYESPTLKEIQEYGRRDMATFWDEFKRIKRPHLYKVDLSGGLYNLKKRLLNEQK